MSNKKGVILYIDDEQSNLIAFTAAFRRYYTVHTASSAREGMEILKKEPIQLIITDQRMPEMTGVQFLEAIINEYPNPIRMILTGFSDVSAIIRAINSGRILRYITKPWTEGELKQIIDQGLKLYEVEEKNRALLVDLQREIAKQQVILNLFQKYVPEHVVREALALEDESHYTETRIISVLFSDIRNFSGLAEVLPPEDLVKLLNDYFTLMSECIKKNKGYVNKFLGDGILAIFGAPVSYIDNPANAVLCGLEMLEVLKEFNARYASQINRELKIGIGISTGEVVVGNIGSKDRIEYTAIGDTVNVAFRIESLTHDKDNTLLISKSTYEPSKHLIEAEDFGLHSVKGREQKVYCYHVLGKRIDKE